MSRREFMQAGATTAAATAITPLTGSDDAGPVTLPFAVVFEVQTTAETHQSYLETARKLRPMLDTILGFLSIERSSSLLKENCLLSLSYWADEAALVQWRSTGEHHAAQQAGRDGIFADYRLRVGPVLFENLEPGSTPNEPISRYNRPPFHAGHYMSLARVDDVRDPKAFEHWLANFASGDSIAGLHGYRSLSNPGRYYLTLPSTGWAEALRHREAFRQQWAGSHGASLTYLQLLEVERDYGMEVREQAPQFFRAPERGDGRRSS